MLEKRKLKKNLQFFKSKFEIWNRKKSEFQSSNYMHTNKSISLNFIINGNILFNMVTFQSSNVILIILDFLKFFK